METIIKRGRLPALIVLMAALLVLSAQAASAYYYILDLGVEPTNITTTGMTTITVYAHDEVRGGAPNAKGTIFVSSANGNSSIPFTTGADGYYTLNYAATKAGTYNFTATSSFNYSAVPSWHIDVGVQSATSPTRTLHVKSLLIFTVKPNVSWAFPSASASASASPSATVTPTIGEPTAIATSVTPAPSIPASSTDTTAPATVLNISGATNADGEYLGEVLCGLTAEDNEGGSGVNVIQYSFNGTDWYTYTKPLSVVKAGTTFLYFRSSDNAGNTEVANVKAIEIAAAAAGTPTATAPPATTGAKATPGGTLGATAFMLLVTAAMLLIGHKAKDQ